MSDVPSLLPPNATPAMRAIEQALAARLALLDPAVIRSLWNPATCPLALLPWLAWAFAVDVWDSTWPEATKRQVIAASLQVHRQKGTRAALEAALAAVDHPTSVVEWFQANPPAAPYTFSVAVNADAGVDLPELVSIAAIINVAKNLRSWLSSLALVATGASHAYVAAVGHASVTITYPARAVISDPGPIRHGGGSGVSAGVGG